MRHQKQGKKFHREKGQRAAFMRSLANNLIKNGEIKTTEVRAKAVRQFVERAVTIAVKGKLAGKRLLISRLHDKKNVAKLCDELASRYPSRHGGYLRITKLADTRKRDGTRLVKIEFI